MIDFQRILVPSDFSESSREATNYGFALAERFRAELHVVHVLESLGRSLPEAVRHIAQFPENYLEQAREFADKELAASLPSDHAGGREVVRGILQGSPWAEILDYADRQRMDLVVVGTQGRTGVPHLLIGSVAERVVRHASCPVLTVRSPAGSSTETA